MELNAVITKKTIQRWNMEEVIKTNFHFLQLSTFIPSQKEIVYFLLLSIYLL